MRRVFVLFLTQVLLWTIFAQVNHALADLRIYLFAGSLYVVFAALTQPLGAGLASVIAGGLICDANAPASLSGVHLLLFTAAFLLIFRIRDRIPRDDTAARIVVVLLANLALFLSLSFLQISRSPAPGAIWPRLMVDLVCSQVFLALIARWFLALQARALVLAQVDREALV